MAIIYDYFLMDKIRLSGNYLFDEFTLDQKQKDKGKGRGKCIFV